MADGRDGEGKVAAVQGGWVMVVAVVVAVVSWRRWLEGHIKDSVGGLRPSRPAVKAWLDGLLWAVPRGPAQRLPHRTRLQPLQD